jgi:hypothetical protein
MKILKKNYGHRNLILFLIFSVIYTHTIYLISIGKSLFSIFSLRSFFIEHYLILAGAMITGFMVLKIKKYSEIALMIFLIVLVGKNFVLMSNSFNKLTLVSNFVFVVFAFYFFITWELEVALASFNPKFSSHDLEKESRFKIQASIYSNDDKSDAVVGVVTNIDENSCFILLPKNTHFVLNPGKKYLLESIYEDVQFLHSAYLVSAYDRGIGLVFGDSPDARVSWSELYKVCLQRGLVE